MALFQNAKLEDTCYWGIFFFTQNYFKSVKMNKRINCNVIAVNIAVYTLLFLILNYYNPPFIIITCSVVVRVPC